MLSFPPIPKGILTVLLATSLLVACDDTTNQSSGTQDTEITAKPVVPIFDADNAFQYIAKQVSFGPRVSGSTAHAQCAAWMIQELKQYADTVYEQRGSIKQATTNKTYPVVNIIASFQPQLSQRILLLAHWDSRPWADEDIANTNAPIDAADDGASGVAVLMEIARHLKATAPLLGVDIMLVDVEDVGKSEWGDRSYCLGTQYWGANPHIPSYKASWGACLDMVGARGAQFPLEGYSNQYAPDVQKRIWDIANRIGYSDYFRYIRGATITDDHLFVNELNGTPTIDIIHVKPHGGFGSHWHTHADNLQVIDKNTLKAVGQTMLHAIYEP